MRNAVVISLFVLVAGCVGASVATASKLVVPAWTELKAARIVVRDARLAVPSAEKGALEAELRRSLDVFRGLELWALDAGDEDAFRTYHGYVKRFRSALQSVRDGVRIIDADCIGSGRAVGSGRFRQFSCTATSGSLSIPSAAPESLNSSTMPGVIEGDSRELGPYVSQLRVRVTGKVSFSYE